MGSKKKGKRAPERVHFFPQEGASHEGGVGTMTLAEDMRDLCQDIPDSFDARMRWVADVKRQTAELMNGIQARQRERNRETAEMMKGFRRQNQQRAQEVGNMLAGFHREQEAMAGHWLNMTATMAGKRAGKH